MNPQRSGDTGRPGRAQVWTRVAENYAAWLLLMAGIASAGVFLTALRRRLRRLVPRRGYRHPFAVRGLLAVVP